MSSITSGQRDQIIRLAGVALDSLGLSREAAQLVIGRGGDMQTEFRKIVRELSVSNQFAGEEVRSTFRYPKGYKAKPITAQIKALQQLFPGIGHADEEFASRLSLPRGAEALFAIPRWEKLAPTYNEAVELVLRKIAETRKFINYREGQVGPDRLRQHARSIEMWARLGEQQNDHDILVVPVQFAFLHRGHSVRRAREVFMASEFGLGAFANGIMLLTHPERLVSYDDLWIDCAGDEYDSPGGDGRFDRAPFFRFGDGGVGFDTRWVYGAYESCGASSGFVPQ